MVWLNFSHSAWKKWVITLWRSSSTQLGPTRRHQPLPVFSEVEARYCSNISSSTVLPLYVTLNASCPTYINLAETQECLNYKWAYLLMTDFRASYAKKQPLLSVFYPIWPLTSFPFGNVGFKNGAGDGLGEGMAQMGQLQTKQLENQHVQRWWAETLPKPQQSVNQYPLLICIIIAFNSSSIPALNAGSNKVQHLETQWAD